jgi:hypothetical protein
MSTKGGTAEQSPFRPLLEDNRAFFITPQSEADASKAIPDTLRRTPVPYTEVFSSKAVLTRR